MLPDTMSGEKIIYTIGHSTRAIDEFIALLKENEIEVLVDVRTIPMSRRYPHFNQENMARSLPEAGIEYIHMPALGGRRGKRKDLVEPHNNAWENSAFRNYADYAETEPFQTGLNELIALATQKRTAYMCSEAVWWKCHRRIITDYMLARGFQVKHIMAPRKADDAKMNEDAVVHEDGRITYPGKEPTLWD
jgi:uncharacterized protein (DUF488 family)